MTWPVFLGSILFVMFSLKLGGVTSPPGKKTGPGSLDCLSNWLRPLEVRKSCSKESLHFPFWKPFPFFLLGLFLYWLWFDSFEASVLWLFGAGWAGFEQTSPFTKAFPASPVMSDLGSSWRTYVELEDTRSSAETDLSTSFGLIRRAEATVQ